MHLPITVVKIPPKTLITQPFPCIAVTALVFRVGFVELIAGQFKSQGQKISQRRIHLQNLRGFSWLVKNPADFAGSAQNTQILERFFAAAEQFLHLLIRNWFLTLSYGLRRQCCPFSETFCKCFNAESEGSDQWRLSDGFHC